MIIRVNNPERLCRFPLAPNATLRVTDDISVSYDRDNLPPINTHCCCFILILQGRNIARHRVTTTQKRLAGHAGSALSAGRRQDRSRQRPTRRPADRPAPVLPGRRDLSPLSASPPGGIVGGDELTISAHLDPGCHTLITMPAPASFTAAAARKRFCASS